MEDKKLALYNMIVNCRSNGEPLSIRKMMNATGLGVQQVHIALWHLWQEGKIEYRH